VFGVVDADESSPEPNMHDDQQAMLGLEMRPCNITETEKGYW
jgi:hypothetical protein